MAVADEHAVVGPLGSVPWKEGPDAAAAAGPVLVVATRARLHRWRDVPAIVSSAMALRRQWPELDGAVALELSMDWPRKTSYSVSVWRDEASMRSFLRLPDCVDAMRQYADAMTVTSESWEAPRLDRSAAWAEARRRLVGAAAGEPTLRRRAVFAWAGGKAVFGVWAVVAPRLLGGLVVGGAADQPATQAFLRGLGGRDVAAGLAVLLAPTLPIRRAAVLLGVMGDAADTLAAARSFGTLRRATRWLSLATAVGMVVSGLGLAAAGRSPGRA